MNIFANFHEDMTKNVDILSLANFREGLVFISSDFIMETEIWIWNDKRSTSVWMNTYVMSQWIITSPMTKIICESY